MISLRHAFHKAVKKFDVDVIKELVAANQVDVNSFHEFASKGEKLSALQYAASLKKHEVSHSSFY